MQQIPMTILIHPLNARHHTQPTGDTDIQQTPAVCQHRAPNTALRGRERNDEFWSQESRLLVFSVTLGK